MPNMEFAQGPDSSSVQVAKKKVGQSRMPNMDFVQGPEPATM